MYVRFTFFTGERLDPDRAVEHLEVTARPRVEAAPGNRGFVTGTGTDPRRVVAVSYWTDAAAMAAPGATLDVPCEQASTAEEFRMVVGFRRCIPAGGAALQLVRLRFAPDEIATVERFYRDESVPRVKGAAGLCSFQVLVDPGTGTGVVASAWENERVLREFWPTAQLLRAQAARLAGVGCGATETYRLVRTSVQLG